MLPTLSLLLPAPSPAPGQTVKREAPPTFVEAVHVDLELRGEAAGDQYGWIARNAGDANGDGVVDLWISAPGKDLDGANAGRCYLHSGKDGMLLFQCDGVPGDSLGIGIDAAGDVDADGHSDVIAGAMGAEGTGAAFIYSGVDGEVLHEFFGEGQGDRFGRKVAGAGDLDGDGYADVIVGAPNHDGPAGADAGRAYVFSGESGEVLLTLDGEAPGDQFASCVGGHAGDDARLLVIGAMNAGEGDRGRTYVYRFAMEGGEARASLHFVIEPEADDVNLGRMFVSAVGDVNGDGHVDVYASDWDGHVGELKGAGRAYVHDGKTGTRLLTFLGEHAGEGMGIGTAEAGDVDGDGADDVLVGSWQYAKAAPGGGRATLYSGRTGAVLATYTCSTPGETFGFDTTALGDLDGDGQLEFLISSGFSGVRGKQSGRALVISAGELATVAPKPHGKDASAQEANAKRSGGEKH